MHMFCKWSINHQHHPKNDFVSSFFIVDVRGIGSFFNQLRPWPCWPLKWHWNPDLTSFAQHNLGVSYLDFQFYKTSCLSAPRTLYLLKSILDGFLGNYWLTKKCRSDFFKFVLFTDLWPLLLLLGRGITFIHGLSQRTCMVLKKLKARNHIFLLFFIFFQKPMYGLDAHVWPREGGHSPFQSHSVRLRWLVQVKGHWSH